MCVCVCVHIFALGFESYLRIAKLRVCGGGGGEEREGGEGGGCMQ